MTKTAQDFTGYSGDDIALQFTNVDGDGAALNISTAHGFSFSVRRDYASDVILTKTFGAGIAFLTTGADGVVIVTLGSADTTSLSGWYVFRLTMLDAYNNQSTLAIGRVNVFPVPLYTYSGDPSYSSKDAVRFYLNDTTVSAAKFSDTEINFALTTYPNPLRAAAACARALAAKYASKPSKRVADLSISWGEISKNFYDLATSLDLQADSQISGPYAGGVRISDKEAVNSDSDRNAPSFSENQFDNPSSDGNIADPWSSNW